MGFVSRIFSPPKPPKPAPTPPPPPPAPKMEPEETDAQKTMRKRRAAQRLGGAGYGRGSTVLADMEQSGTGRTVLGS